MVTFTGRQARLDNADARANELADIRQRAYRYPDRAKEACEYLAAQAKTRDAYFGVHLYREAGSRLASNAISAISCLWLDEDEGQFPETGPAPTAVVRSSDTRRHLYWRLTRTIPAGKTVELNRRIAVWSGGDIGKAGLASVLRVPGTWNYKRHPHVDPVVGELTGSGPWEPEVLEQAIPPLPTPVQPDAPRGPYDGPEVEIADYLNGIEILSEAPDEGGVKFAIVCPWISQHSGGDRTGTYFGQYSNGAVWFYCWHEHCRRRSLQDYKQALGIHRRVPSRSKARRVWRKRNLA